MGKKKEFKIKLRDIIANYRDALNSIDAVSNFDYNLVDELNNKLDKHLFGEICRLTEKYFKKN